MNDFFDEIRTELQTDRRRAAWKKLAPLVYVAASLIILATAGNELYGVWRKDRIEGAALSFEGGLAALREGRHDESRDHFHEIAEGSGQFSELAAHFIAGMEIHAANTEKSPPDQEVAELVQEGTEQDQEGIEQAKEGTEQEQDGIEQVQESAEQIKENARIAAATALWKKAGIRTPLSRMAMTKAAYLSADKMSLEELTSRLSALLESGGHFSILAREILAAKAFTSGDLATASGYYASIQSDPESWPEINKRVEQALSLIEVRSFSRLEEETPDLAIPDTSLDIPSGAGTQ